MDDLAIFKIYKHGKMCFHSLPGVQSTNMHIHYATPVQFHYYCIIVYKCISYLVVLAFQKLLSLFSPLQERSKIACIAMWIKLVRHFYLYRIFMKENG